MAPHDPVVSLSEPSDTESETEEEDDELELQHHDADDMIWDGVMDDEVSEIDDDDDFGGAA